MAKRQPSAYFLKRLEEIKADPTVQVRALAKRRYQHIHRETTRHGKTVYYYRKPKGRRIRLPDPDHVEPDVFNRAYLAAKRGVQLEAEGSSKPLPGCNSTAGKPGFVYFVRAGNAVKIGFSTSVKRRIRSIQTGCSDEAEIVKVIPGTNQTERYFHTHFRAYHQRGEWFMLEGELASFLAFPAPSPLYRRCR